MDVVLLCILCYSIGTFSPGYILGKLFKNKDIRKHGSGSSGATNAVRTFGWKFGLATLVLDMLKGILAVKIGELLLGSEGMLIGGGAVVVGHVWPVFLNFKGGKGVATSAGVIVAIDYKLLLLLLSVFIVVFIATKIVSLSSITAAISLPIIYLIVNHLQLNWPKFIALILLSAIVIYRHHENIVRILQGKEQPLNLKGKLQ